MPLDPYAACSCGSGKKFKWCCQPIHTQLEHVREQDFQGQHEAALRLMDQMVAQHPDNPEVWGRKAELLYRNDRPEDAEAALQKAFELSPNYPFGWLLRGMFRYYEGEIPGALLCFRKAAEVYDPEAHGPLTQVYSMIADCDMRMNRPVAARAALEITRRLDPGDPELEKSFEGLFGQESRLPESARRAYSFLSPSPGVSRERRAAWDRLLKAGPTTRLSDLARAFDELTQQNAEDAAAWHNLGVARAWLGDNPGALDALDRYVALETDEGRAAQAWALGEVLRCGQGMEERADYLDYSVSFQVRNPEAVLKLMEEWHRDRRLVIVQASREQLLISALVLEQTPMLTVGSAGGQMAHLACYWLLAGDLLRLWFSRKETLDRVKTEVQLAIGPALSGPHERTGPANFGDVLAESLALPAGPMPEEEMERRVREQAERYFEEVWLHRPLRSLNQIAPIDAAGSPGLRKKLRGDVQFLQECAAVGGMKSYDFDRLRRKLGLAGTAPAAPAAAGAAPDIGAMSAAELAGLAVDQLATEQLEQAWRTAQRLDANELGERFARALVARPADGTHPDRFPWFNYLATRALAEGRGDEALELVSQGESFDRTHNEGRRENEYELRRAQLYARRGEADQASAAFEKLIERAPTDLKYPGTAAEAMLTLKRGAQALRFAEKGLAAARKQNNRDSVQYYLELVAAAKKAGG